MANPNRAMAYVAKNPFEHVMQSCDFGAANRAARECKEAGFDVRVTSQRMGRHPKTWMVWNVWKR